MSVRYKLKIIWLILFFKLSTAECCFSQNSTFEIWPESDIWYRLSPSWRLSSFIALTKYYESKSRDLNIYLQADYAWGKSKYLVKMRLMDEIKAQQIKGWMARGGFMEGRSLGERSGEYIEDMLFAEIHRRTPLKGNALFSSRFRTDLRWLGDDSKFSYRFRARLMLEKEFIAGQTYIIPFVNAEPFWDSRYLTFSRLRVIGGAVYSRGSRFAFESNLTYQYDENYSSANLYAINLILHVYFETKRSRSNNSK
jgi:hypothetical protein